MKRKLAFAVLAGVTLAGCATNDSGRPPNIGVGVAINGAPATAPESRGGPPPWAPAHGRRAKEASYRYYYYPSAGVYYNVSTRSYFYLDGGNWQVSMSLPSGLIINTGDYVSLELNTDKPYQYYEEHKVKYKGNNGRGHGHGKAKFKEHGPPF